MAGPQPIRNRNVADLRTRPAARGQSQGGRRRAAARRLV